MQTLVEAKLKRAYNDGVAARAGGAQQGGSLHVNGEASDGGGAQSARQSGGTESSAGASAARADANMAALLEQIELEDEG